MTLSFLADSDGDNKPQTSKTHQPAASAAAPPMPMMPMPPGMPPVMPMPMGPMAPMMPMGMSCYLLQLFPPGIETVIEKLSSSNGLSYALVVFCCLRLVQSIAV